jgi:zinc protease
LGAALDLLRQVLREPALPAAEFEVLKRQRLADLEQSRTDPQSLAINKLQGLIMPYSKDDVRYRPSIAEQIERAKSATLDQVKRLHAEFLGAQGELVLLGDFDAAEISPKLSSLFAGWQAKQSYSRLPEQAFLDVTGSKQSINTPDKANAAYVAGLVAGVSDTHADYPALVIGNYIFGGGSLSSRLGDRVRQKEGLSYGVGSQFRGSSVDPFATLSVSAISNPENAPKVDKAIREELEKLLKDGVTAEELARAKKGYLQSQAVNRTNDRQLGDILSGTLFADRTMQFYAAQEKQIEALTAEQVVAALRKHIEPKRFVVVTAGDFGAKKE